MNGTPLSSMLLVLVASLIGSFGAVFLKLGAAKLHGGFWKILNPQLGIGVVLFCGSSVFYTMGIRHGQLSVLYPMVSLGYVWTLVWSRIFFHEALTPKKFIGLGMVLVGVCCVSMGG